ncbi:aminomethyltransferase beta-barrel domain-containing protein, partial [Eubacterium coprostanoligenes]|uniref:aminomethyltransferase beta-barrel domain-containing protein n=1 Tax=Eubacterium coprostanoligenes TaxID=290054 RepID=UPI002A834919
KSLTARDFNWIAQKPDDKISCFAKTRYNMHEVPCVAYCDGDRVVVEFNEPVRAITPGQAVVLYDGDYVLGGGTIE